jgi:hypothetical protein
LLCEVREIWADRLMILASSLASMRLMGSRLLKFSLRHRSVVTVALLVGLLVNLLVIGSTETPRGFEDDHLPSAAQCHGGGGAGCAEQPLIPPPAIGMPRMSAVEPVVFGVPALIAAGPTEKLHASPPPTLERPPLSAPVG